MQKGELQPELPKEKQTKVADVGGAAHAYLSFMLRAVRAADASEGARRRGIGGDGGRGAPKKASAQVGLRSQAHVLLSKQEKGSSIQEVIHAELRRRAVRVQDLFKRWDCDKSNSIGIDEFCMALQELRVTGTDDDYRSLFYEWDADGSGSLQYTELLAALSGQRYDAFQKQKAPPLPPLLICAPADPFDHNGRWLEDVRLLANSAVDDANALSPFTPLGRERGNLSSSMDLPAWSRPQVFCDPSGAPQQLRLLPIGAAWRHLFPSRPVPLWIGFAPGNTFAVTRDAVLRRGAAFYQHALATCGLDQRHDAVAGQALERLWSSVFAGAPNHDASE